MESEIKVVRRDKVIRWYRVTKTGQEYRWKMVFGTNGTIQFLTSDNEPVSPVFDTGIGQVRGWLLANGYTPAGNRSAEWRRAMGERRGWRKPGAAA